MGIRRTVSGGYGAVWALISRRWRHSEREPTESPSPFCRHRRGEPSIANVVTGSQVRTAETRITA